jgi:rubrerythrin
VNRRILEELPVFLAHALELETDSAERLREFAGMLEQHHQHELAVLFTELAVFSDKHAEEVAQICSEHALPVLTAWEFAWPDAEAPETCTYDAVRYEMTAADALRSMLAQEVAAADFYADIASRSQHAEIRRYAAMFAEEEREHVVLLQAWQARERSDAVPAPDMDPPHQPE